MNGVIVYPLTFGFPDKGIQQFETINFGFQFVLENGREATKFGIHDQNGQGNPTMSEFNTLVGHSDSDGITGVCLQGFGYFKGATAVTGGLNHGNHLRGRLQIGSEVIQVVHQGIQVDFQHRFVHFQGETFTDLLKPIGTRALDQNGGIFQLFQEA